MLQEHGCVCSLRKGDKLPKVCTFPQPSRSFLSFYSVLSTIVREGAQSSEYLKTRTSPSSSSPRCLLSHTLASLFAASPHSTRNQASPTSAMEIKCNLCGLRKSINDYSKTSRRTAEPVCLLFPDWHQSLGQSPSANDPDLQAMRCVDRNAGTRCHSCTTGDWPRLC